MLFPQTMTVFRCSNELCQEEKDKQADKRIKLMKDKEVTEQLRAEKKAQDKAELQNKKLESAR